MAMKNNIRQFLS